jgi:hypothetical protein
MMVRGLRGRFVGARTDGDTSLGDHGAVGLEDNAVDILEVVGVGDELVTGENILLAGKEIAGSALGAPLAWVSMAGQAADARTSGSGPALPEGGRNTPCR